MFPYLTILADVNSDYYYCSVLFLGEKLPIAWFYLLAEDGLLKEVLVAANGVEILLIIMLLLCIKLLSFRFMFAPTANL